MNNFEKIWIAGANGRIGREFVKKLDPLDYEILDTDIDEVDITNLEEVLLFAERNRPEIIINCAAITNPKKCEDDFNLAFSVNGLGARNIAIASRRINAKLIHISTDDVFDGQGDKPYREFDKAEPINMYGKSKLFGEEYIKTFSYKYFIVRSSWLYGKTDRKVEEIIEKAKNGEVIEVASEQYAAPTSAKELSDFIVKLMKTDEYGTYHAVCKGYTNRKEFAKKVLEICNIKGEVKEVEENFNAKYRPNFTVLDDFLLSVSKVYDFPSWEEALKMYIEEEVNGKN